MTEEELWNIGGEHSLQSLVKMETILHKRSVLPPCTSQPYAGADSDWNLKTLTLAIRLRERWDWLPG